MKRKIISVLLVLTLLLPLLLTGCGTQTEDTFELPSTDDLTPYAFQEDKTFTRKQTVKETVTEEVEDAEGNVTKVQSEKDVDYSTVYVLAQENDNYELYFSEEILDIALVDKKSGEIWYSNPGAGDRANAGGLKSEMSSQLEIFYVNKKNNSQGFKNTFSDCIGMTTVDETTKEVNKQYYMVNHDGALRIIYIMGKVQKEFAIPTVMTSEDMDALVKMLKDDGKGSLAFMLKSTYLTLTPKAWANQPSQKQEDYTEIAPMIEDLIVNQGKTMYLIGDKTKWNNEAYMEKIEEIFVDYLGYDLTKRDEENAKYGVVAEVPDVFWVPIDYKLEEDGLKVSVKNEDISYNDATYEISTLEVLKYFGAGDKDENGYMFVPDGSGALINFNNNKTQINDPVEIPIYGLDEGRERETQPFLNQQGYLPVFGIKKEKSALFAIMESGASVATVIADISGKTSVAVDKNIIYPSYKLVEFQALSTVMTVMTLRVYQEERMSSDIDIKYTILSEDKADYSGMAEFYRNYLYEKGVLQDSELSAAIPFNLELIGGCSEKTAFLGISYQKMYALTTFDQAKDIIDQLIAKGITNISINYRGWANGGLRNSLYNNIKVLSELGGVDGLKDLMAYGAEKGVTIYPEAEILYVYKDKLFDGFNALSDTSRMVNRKNAKHAQYNIVTQTTSNYTDTKNQASLIGPTKLKETSANVLKNYQKMGLTSVSLGGLSSNLASNFKVKDFYDREMVMKAYTDIAEQFTDSGMKMMGKGVNSYMLGSVERIFEISNTSSNFVLADASVPFYQMVIHGAIQYSGEAINLNGDTTTVFLQAVEAGAGLYYRWSYAPNDELKDINFVGIYSLNYEPWIDQAAELYTRYNDLLSQTANQAMVHHDMLEEGVVKVTYEDGTTVYVNYNATDYTQDGLVVPAEDFVVTKGGNTQ